MEFQEGFINRQPKLYYRCLSPDQPRGAVLIVHGAGEHIGRYEYLQKRLYESGFVSIGCDLRGLGRSEGFRSHINRFEDYLEDIEATDQLLTDQYKGIPAFLLGHSMGGLLALAFAERHPGRFLAVFVSSPFLGFKIPVSPMLKAVAGVLSVLWPTVSFDNGIRSDMVSRNADTVKGYRTDPYVYGKVTARWFTEISRGIEQTHCLAPEMKDPLLLFQAECDKLVDAAKSRQFYERCGSMDKQFDLIKGAYHEILNEPDRDITIDRVIGFFAARL